MTGISRRRWGRASWLRVGGVVLVTACGARAGTKNGVDPTAVRLVPLASVIVLETAGPPPSDTTVTFTAGEPQVIVLRHGPPENVVFAELVFPPSAFRADSGRPVRIEVRPRPGVYGLDLTTSVPIGEGAAVVFKYARYFSAPARARAAYGSDVLYERALAVAQYRPGGEVALLPSTHPVADNLQSALPAAGTYVVAAAP
jgi:hypothetical protein